MTSTIRHMGPSSYGVGCIGGIGCVASSGKERGKKGAVRITMQSMYPMRHLSRSVSSASDARSMYTTMYRGGVCVPGTFLNRALG